MLVHFNLVHCANGEVMFKMFCEINDYMMLYF